MGVYSHIIEGMQEDMMALLDEVLPSRVCQSVAVTYRGGGPKNAKVKSRAEEHGRCGEGLWEEATQKSKGGGTREKRAVC
jgi:hypothetical protein